MSEALKLPISPLEGEMSGRTEGGAVEHLPWRFEFESKHRSECEKPSL
ncbi:hypothetical protein X743_23555 [Mesorhizobium sp. LNHC252B00]|nr:hypothetical protein X743_23555 [Mesorhizobium sp. LNHC252B00]